MIKQLTNQLLPLTNSATAAQQEAWWLLEHVTGKTKAQLLFDCTLTFEQETELKKILQLRITQQMPLAYVLGTVPFGELTLAVRPPILIPRHETEEICEWVVKELILKQVQDDGGFRTSRDDTSRDDTSRDGIRILDIGTGSGCIALYLAQALPHSDVVGIDINQAAIELAIENKIRNKISNAEFRLGDVLDSLCYPSSLCHSGLSGISESPTSGDDKPTVFDLIISNPPYVTESEYAELEADVARWEDKGALVADDNGLALYKKIVTQAPQYLNAGGILVFEIGYKQGKAVATLMEAAEFESVTVHQDSFGHDRWVVGKQPKK